MSNNKWSKVQLQNVTSLRIDEHNTWVTLFSTCLATTALLLIALFNTGSLPIKSVGIIICSFGFFISLVYFYVQNRALVAMKNWEKAIEQIEVELKKSSTKIFIKSSTALGARSVMTLVTFSQVVGWGIGILYFLCNK